MDFYLKFTDEAAANAVLYRTDGVTDDSEGYVVANFKNIDVIGVIYKNEQPLDGWHVNVRVMDGEDSSSIAPFSVIPTVPVRVWG